MLEWKRLRPTTVRTVGWRRVVIKTFQLPDGRVETYGTVARQFRPGPERLFDELPGGGVEPYDESFEAAARRELLEETGYIAGTMEFLGDMYKDAYQNTTWHYFLARNCLPHPEGQKLDETEHILICLVSITELMDNARSGHMTDPGAVLLAYDRLESYKEGMA